MKTYQVPNFLTTDPYNKRGESGIVVEQKDDIVRLKFKDGTTGIYSEDCLVEIKG